MIIDDYSGRIGYGVLDGIRVERTSEETIDTETSRRKAGDLDVSVDMDALERDDKLSKDEIKKRYDEQRERENAGGWSGAVDRDDLSSMIAEEGAKRLKKDRERANRR